MGFAFCVLMKRNSNAGFLLTRLLARTEQTEAGSAINQAMSKLPSTRRIDKNRHQLTISVFVTKGDVFLLGAYVVLQD